MTILRSLTVAVCLLTACGAAPAVVVPTEDAAPLETAIAATKAARPTALPPTAVPTESPVMPAPTAALDPAAQMVEVARAAASPNLRDGAWTAERGDYGNGPRITLVMPLNDLGSNEQIVRLNQIRMTGAALALLDTYPEIVEINVQGTLPLNGQEANAISLLLTRAQRATWDGHPSSLPGWQVSARLS